MESEIFSFNNLVIKPISEDSAAIVDVSIININFARWEEVSDFENIFGKIQEKYH